MSRYKYILLACLLVFSSCDKEITLPYRSVDPLYVIEGRVTNEVMEVLITKTKDMEDGTPATGLGNAFVNIYGDDGFAQTLFYGSDGYYRTPVTMSGTRGRTYTLSVDIDGQQYTSTSRMGDGTAYIEQMYFQWLTIMKERVLFFTFVFRDIEGEDNYYCYRLRRNGESYRWNVMHDRGNDGEYVLVNIYCVAEQVIKDNKQENWKDILYEGDEIELELQTIDKKTYDYLYSVGLSERTSANPIDNFTGGCLGYFSAYSSSKWVVAFTYDFE